MRVEFYKKKSLKNVFHLQSSMFFGFKKTQNKKIMLMNILHGHKFRSIFIVMKLICDICFRYVFNCRNKAELKVLLVTTYVQLFPLFPVIVLFFEFQV